MDDQRFDDIIKKKVGEYEESGFDPSALSALHQQIASASAWPWYARYKTELMIASGMALCTLIIVWSQWYFRNIENNLLKDNTAEVSAQQEQIKNLLHEITLLKNHPPDTVRVTERVESPNSSGYSLLLLQRIANLEGAMSRMQKELETYRSDARSGSSEIDRAENFYKPSNEGKSNYSYFHSSRLLPKNKERTTAHANNRGLRTPAPNIDRTLSTETLRDLEKHYQRGIGVRVGPTIELSRGFYDGGITKFDLAGGALGDFILSPSISIETGAKFSHRFYAISEEDLGSRPLPNVNSTLGPLVYADVDSWILEVPLNLKYRYPLNMKTNWVGGIGYSSRLYTQQVFEYDHSVDGNPGARLTTSTRINKMHMYPGTLNVSLGLGHQLKNKKTLETSLFYQHGLGKAGIEKMSANFFGIRSIYWFTIK